MIGHSWLKTGFNEKINVADILNQTVQRCITLPQFSYLCGRLFCYWSWILQTCTGHCPPYKRKTIYFHKITQISQSA